jgi:hypothetical protein
MAFQGNKYLRANFVIDNKVIEQIKEFNYLGCSISCINDKDIHMIHIQDFRVYVELFGEQF